ncbi:MAG: NAD(P)-dependent oxidoreductase, partial [Hyphomicrobiales bacterium]|nr:NAD(P)-dependent oxidoreductase [Hyphomicrobiales bacterium]
MSTGSNTNGIAAGRLNQRDYTNNFDELHPPLSLHEAMVAADRCYFCYDAPCTDACPTTIDIPLFIRQIATGNPIGSAETIFTQNILGGMCARVCPTETLCEEVCVREEAEGKPVKIGELQRYATDFAMERKSQFFERAPATGKKIAIVGAGPAGLACAHRLAIYGHEVKIFDAKKKSGGLNEYGIAVYKTVGDFAAREVEYVISIGGITIENNHALGRDISLDDLSAQYDAVFLGIGLGATGDLGIEDENVAGVEDAIDFIEALRQADDYSSVPIGRKVVVIGGGMTAIDVAVQARHLGAQDVSICYRRGKDQMAASVFEQDLAASNGVTIRHWLQPAKIISEGENVTGVEFEYTSIDDGKLKGTGETTVFPADQVFKAIGQKLDGENLSTSGLTIVSGRIAIDENGQ